MPHVRSRHRRVADFNTLPALIEHAKTTDGATHILVLGRLVKLYFPTIDGRYEEGVVWQQNGYWHAPAQSARTVVSRLPAGADPIGSGSQRAGRKVTAAGRRAPVMKLASELSRETRGSPPKLIPGGYRWSEQNESAQFTTYSPEYNQKVVVVVSIFADGSATVGFFGDEGTSETDRYENIGHFMYETTADLPEMKKDIEWVWETVDGYAASWQEDEEGNPLEEARRGAEREPSFKRVGARVKYNYTDGPIPAGMLGTIIGFLPRSYQAQIRWDNETVSNHTPDEYDVIRRNR